MLVASLDTLSGLQKRPFWQSAVGSLLQDLQVDRSTWTKISTPGFEWPIQATMTVWHDLSVVRNELTNPDDPEVGPLLDFWWTCWPRIDCAVTCWAKPSERLLSQPQRMLLRPAHWMPLARCPWKSSQLLNLIERLQISCSTSQLKVDQDPWFSKGIEILQLEFQPRRHE
ncbi:hypothetical protein BKA81DRAFT_171690 [Phyllosticta paracitricarpa]